MSILAFILQESKKLIFFFAKSNMYTGTHKLWEADYKAQSMIPKSKINMKHNNFQCTQVKHHFTLSVGFTTIVKIASSEQHQIHKSLCKGSDWAR